MYAYTIFDKYANEYDIIYGYSYDNALRRAKLVELEANGYITLVDVNYED